MVQYLFLLFLVITSYSQDYQVADIRCQFPDEYPAPNLFTGKLSARLRKPPGFMGHPLFADARYVNPQRDVHCQIRREAAKDHTGLVYSLSITDFSRCGVTKKDGYVNVRVWFPQLTGVVLATDQEVIIMCKPASPTIIENRAAGFAGSLPSIGRVTGVVEESPGRLEYEVVLLKESQGRSGSEQDLVDQAVPIGSRLQLRAKIDTDSAAWKYVKLMEVTVSTDPHDARSPDHVVLVAKGCRKNEFRSIVPHQPKRSRSDPGVVVLEFQAFMLDTKVEGSSQLWIHATIKACVMEADCSPEKCVDLHEPTTTGRRLKRSRSERIPLQIFPKISRYDVTPVHHKDLIALHQSRNFANMTEELQQPTGLQELLESEPKKTGIFTEVGDNVGLQVIFPEKFFIHARSLANSCNSFMVLSTCLGVGLTVAIGFLCFVTARLQKTVENTRIRTLDKVIREHQSKFGVHDLTDPTFQYQ